MLAFKIVILTFSTVALCGCAAVDNIMRSQPSTGVSTVIVNSPSSNGSNELPYGMAVYLVGFDGKRSREIPENEGFGSEQFLTVDVSGIMKAGFKGSIPLADEKQIISFLILVSDHNANLWMNRIYALNKARHGLVDGLKNLTATGSGLSAFLSPPASASLGATNLLIGGASDEIDNQIYEGKSIDVLFKGIEAARAVELASITKNLSAANGTSYSIFTALGDVAQYDSLVSFRKGLEYLASIADATTTGAKNSTAAAAAGDTSATPTIQAPAPPK